MKRSVFRAAILAVVLLFCGQDLHAQTLFKRTLTLMRVNISVPLSWKTVDQSAEKATIQSNKFSLFIARKKAVSDIDTVRNRLRNELKQKRRTILKTATVTVSRRKAWIWLTENKKEYPGIYSAFFVVRFKEYFYYMMLSGPQNKLEWETCKKIFKSFYHLDS